MFSYLYGFWFWPSLTQAKIKEIKHLPKVWKTEEIEEVKLFLRFPCSNLLAPEKIQSWEHGKTILLRFVFILIAFKMYRGFPALTFRNVTSLPPPSIKHNESESWSVVSDSLWPPMDHTVRGILQARILEWVAFLFSKGPSQPRDWIQVSCNCRQIL